LTNWLQYANLWAPVDRTNIELLCCKALRVGSHNPKGNFQVSISILLLLAKILASPEISTVKGQDLNIVVPVTFMVGWISRDTPSPSKDRLGIIVPEM
jgi:hypothetical protein